MTFTIRAATRADADGITDVQVASWRVGYAHVFPDSVLFADDFESSRRAFWNEWRFAPGHRIAVAVEAHLDDPVEDALDTPDDGRVDGRVVGRVVGFSSYGQERERARGFTGRGEVWAFYLHPDAWGSGAASALMQHTEDRMRAEGFDTAVLWVLDDNPRARAFYEKFGWHPSGLAADFDRYCEATVPEVEYRKELS
ncbi:MAG: GNAT family N-acetyltransferase [Ilumatobacteraceae bacterium]